MAGGVANISAADIAAARKQLPRLFAVPMGTSIARALVAAAIVLYMLWAGVQLGITPQRIQDGVSQLGGIVRLMVPPTDNGQAWAYVQAMGETLGMAFFGTVIAALIALPLGFLGASTVVTNPVLHFAIRRVFDVFRATPSLIWALIFIGVVGLGPMAGVMALILGDFAALAKLYAEAIENADRKPIEGLEASGAARSLVLRFGVLPQVLPVMLSQALYFFESNVRNATVFGIVGAGGIGFFLNERIKLALWDQAAFIILFFLVTVAIIDMISHRIRNFLTKG
jgi:phosphonate transport system permease protein